MIDQVQNILYSITTIVYVYGYDTAFLGIHVTLTRINMRILIGMTGESTSVIIKCLCMFNMSDAVSSRDGVDVGEHMDELRLDILLGKDKVKLFHLLIDVILAKIVPVNADNKPVAMEVLVVLDSFPMVIVVEETRALTDHFSNHQEYIQHPHLLLTIYYLLFTWSENFPASEDCFSRDHTHPLAMTQRAL